IFNGNGYGDEWKAEAKKRGLDCETSAPIIFDNYLKESSIKMFEKTNVMTKFELEARNEIKWETYTKKIQIESRIFGDLCLNHIIPVVTKYQSMLIDNVSKVMSIFAGEKAHKISKENIFIIEKISEHESFIIENVEKMVEARKAANKIESEREKAIAYHDTVAPLLEEIRYHVDKLETIVDDEAWPLPKYRELLFIR
ncbi:MAG: glutamine synthetase type III, partial [Prevotella sp.]|nr:glutamine synthetase type III [Prevotella sp.]